MFCWGCAHQPLSGSDLDRVRRPAFISRIDEGAGPQSAVFREDAVFQGKLKKLDPREADRRLQLKLAKAITRFETSDRLRASALAHVTKERPWTNAVDPAAVASALESFLVEEVPANPPDYDLLRPLGTDAVVEFVIEEYGLRSSGGRTGAFIAGYGRMFFLGGAEIWRQRFRADQIDLGRGDLDPFKVAQEPELFRGAIASLLDKVGVQFGAELSPPDRRQGYAAAPRSEKSSISEKPRAAEKASAPDGAPEVERASAVEKAAAVEKASASEKTPAVETRSAVEKSSGVERSTAGEERPSSSSGLDPAKNPIRKEQREEPGKELIPDDLLGPKR